MPTKLITTTEKGGKEKEKKKIQKNLQSKSKHKTNECFSWVTAVRVLSLVGNHSPPHLPKMPSNTVIYTPVFLPGESPSLTEKPGRSSFTGWQRVGLDWSNAVRIDGRPFLPVTALPQWELSMKMVQLLGLWGSWKCLVWKDMHCLCCRSYDPIRVFVFFWASCSWQSEALCG